jgi:hypothetical protein
VEQLLCIGGENIVNICISIGYNIMKKTLLIFALCLFAAGSSFAQNNMQDRTLLTVNALMQYGQRLYDRGDYGEATAVFNHVLIYDAHQAQAWGYLKKMEHSPRASISPSLKAQEFVPFVPVENVLEKEDSEIPPLKAVDVSNEQSLEEAIKAQRLIIEKLKGQVEKLRANIAAQ